MKKTIVDSRSNSNQKLIFMNSNLVKKKSVINNNKPNVQKVLT
jgi:hypothetical protein